FIYSFYFVFRTFNGNYKPEQLPHKPHEAPIGMLISPILLAALVVIIFFIPNLIGNTFVKPAVQAIQPFLYDTPQAVDIHVSAWHGINPELLMTIGIIIIGVLLFVALPKWQGIYQRFPQAFTLNNAYDKIMQGLGVGLNRLSRRYMTGSMRHYLLYMFSGIAIIVIGSLFVKDAFSLSFQGASPIRPYEIILIVVLLIGTAITILAKSRLTAIIGLGAVGYTVALFFVIFNAPDLALTQLVIETISVALFLLAFYHLPKLGKREERMRFQLNRAIVSIAVGVMVTLVALSAHSQKLIPSIAKYYEETVYSLAGGGNIVNVILVDYRGFDTLFEITVLGIAGMAILAMIKLRMNRKEKTHENK
ncbi:MAG TPA: Na+/H+ antiporter subunit A, partial [Lysinibacillus sp.]|nr:Na+/H+ antiporter subunit A [Lysinibacillus sp.]